MTLSGLILPTPPPGNKGSQLPRVGGLKILGEAGFAASTTQSRQYDDVGNDSYYIDDEAFGW